jgi:hypothetical protein
MGRYGQTALTVTGRAVICTRIQLYPTEDLALFYTSIHLYSSISYSQHGHPYLDGA